MQLVHTMSFHSEKFGLHWKMVTRVRAIPAALTTNKVAIVAQRKVRFVLDKVR